MLSGKLLLELQAYIEKHQIQLECTLSAPPKYVLKEASHLELETFIKRRRKQSFQQTLFSFIDQKGVSDAEVYKKAGLDRRHFSKIRSNPNYHPGKNTVIALAIALELNKKETGRLLTVAGYSLSESDTFDLVIQFCLEKKIYDLDTINQALEYFSLKPLAGVAE
ncbi:MAG TPA: hypothetical protein GXZ98_04845 [Firmicutes bacterium]|nr:hypothetical protein [Bacillota bacterium]